MPNPFFQEFDELPEILPVFPLTGALLLPLGQMPLNIFEPRYLNMIDAALSSDRLIGMVQPKTRNGDENPPVFRTGCAGRLTQFSETDDGRYLISLTGLCRFDIKDELPLQDGFRRVIPDFLPYRRDLSLTENDAEQIDRDTLLTALETYLRLQGVEANWDAIREADNIHLVTSLAMMCPFQANEKQALLEAPDVVERSRVMTALLQMASLEGEDGAGRAKQ